MAISATIRELRKFYGISQNQLAVFFGITRTQLSMAEIGKRELPTPAMLKLAELYIAMQAPVITGKNNAMQSRLQQQQEKASTIAQSLLRQKESTYTLLKRKLKKLEENHAAALQTLHSIASLQTSNKPKGKTAGLLAAAERRAMKTLQQNGAAIQLKWKIKLIGLKAEMEELRKY